MTQPPNAAARWLKKLPPGVNGMALGLCGGASILLELGLAHDSVLPAALMGVATALWLTFTLRILAAPGTTCVELNDPPRCSAYGAWQVPRSVGTTHVVEGAPPRRQRA
jgi:hypothetical protein